jgi:hypothetical protein
MNLNYKKILLNCYKCEYILSFFLIFIFFILGYHISHFIDIVFFIKNKSEQHLNKDLNTIHDSFILLDLISLFSLSSLVFVILHPIYSNYFYY